VIQPAPDGLRIVLRAKRREPGGVGVTPQFRISGDSEITVVDGDGDIRPVVALDEP
jgi:hypothetical protein